MFCRKFIHQEGLAVFFSILFFSWAGAATEPFESSVREEAPGISGLSFIRGEGFRLEFEAAPGEYSIEFSEDLKNWTPVLNVISSAGVGEFNDEASGGRAEGFYRIKGSFTAADYHILSPTFGIEFSGTAAEEAVGNLWAGISRMDPVLRHTGGEVGEVDFPRAGRSIEGRISPQGALALPAGRLLSLEQPVERNRVDIGFNPDGWTETVPAVAAIPDRPLGNLYSEGSRVVPLTAMEGDRDSLVGLEQRRSVITLVPEATEFLFGRRDVVVPLMARKSVGADSGRLNGPWGFIRFMIEAAPESVRYSGGAYTFQLNPADGEMNFLHAAEAAVNQTIPSEAALTFESAETSLDLHFPFLLKPDGSFEFTADAGPPLSGFVSPSANLFVVGRSRPDGNSIGGAETVILDDSPDLLEFQYGIGVRRELEPQLAGRTYRIVHHGFWVLDGWFDIGMKPSTINEKIVFSSDGSSAERRAYVSFFRTNFSGESNEVQQHHSGDYTYHSVSVDATGRLEMVGGISGEPDSSVRLSGFAQEGGRLLVLLDTVETQQFGFGIGVVIAILEE